MSFAIGYLAYGPPENLELINIAAPPARLRRGHVRLKVLAVSVNPVDWKILAGEQAAFMSRNFPKITATDFLARVTEVSAGSRFALGDLVIGMLNPLARGAALSEMILPENSAIAKLIPRTGSRGKEILLAAGLPAAGITALGTLDRRSIKALLAASPAPRKRRVLVIGASGGVGSLSVQLYRQAGWEVHASSRTEFHEDLRGFGATGVWERDLSDIPSGLRFHRVIDTPGIYSPELARRLVLRGGAWYPIYVPNARIPAILFRSLVNIFNYRLRILLALPRRDRCELLSRLFGEGKLQVPCAEVYGAEKASMAFRDSMRGGKLGKYIISLGGGEDSIWGEGIL